jgi:hypothetical protein
VAKKAAVEAAPAPKRKAPDMTGVAGELVSIEGMELSFGRGQRKVSPYDALLDQLVAAGKGQALRFGDRKARTAVGARAKKKGLRVSFAEAGSVLYVRLDGRTEDDMHEYRRQRILSALMLGPTTSIKLAATLREKGDAAADAQTVDAICGQMARRGEIVKQDGDRWAKNPSHKG